IAAGYYRENLSISNSVNLVGASKDTTFIDGGGAGRVLFIGVETSVQIARLTLTNGQVADTTGGGAIVNFGSLALSDSTVSKSSATPVGGGISNYNQMTIADSTIEGNSAPIGGGIHNSGVLTITGSLVRANAGDNGSGGIDNATVSTLTIASSTVAGNTTSTNLGSDIANQGTLTVKNSTLLSDATYGKAILNFNGSAALANTIISDCYGPVASQG